MTRPWTGWIVRWELFYIDETSSKKGHSHVTLVCDQDRRIIFVCEGKSLETMNYLAV